MDVNLKMCNWVLIVFKSNRVRWSNPDSHGLENLSPAAISGTRYWIDLSLGAHNSTHSSWCHQKGIRRGELGASELCWKNQGKRLWPEHPGVVSADPCRPIAATDGSGNAPAVTCWTSTPGKLSSLLQSLQNDATIPTRRRDSPHSSSLPKLQLKVLHKFIWSVEPTHTWNSKPRIV